MGLLNDLPKPSVSEIGWPWTEETDTELYKKDITYPKISIVTPSYNQGKFIEETIRSVLLQNYPNLEFIIIDGGSTDNTVEILKKYEDWIHYWVSEKDNGQSHAINKGFDKAGGELVGWQNSDDIYYPKAFLEASLTFNKYPQFDVFYGKIYHIDKRSNIINELHLVPFNYYVLKYWDINIANQGIFFRSDIVKEYKINEDYYFTMDAEYYFRLADNNKRFKFFPHFTGGFRIQVDSKTSNYLNISHKETNELRRKYGIPVKEGIPWKKQFLIQKILCLLYILPLKIYYGGLFYYIRKRLF